MKRAISALALSAAMAVAIAGCSSGGVVGPDVIGPPSSIFERAWNAGVDRNEPAFDVQRIDADTFVLRQSIRKTFEAPFVYLIFGGERALLIDTGDQGGDVREEVGKLIAAWAGEHGRAAPELVVMHSHGHGDHKGGDALFAERPGTTMVGLEAEEIEAFFGIGTWPDEVGSIDLGGRVLEIVPTPGHTDSHVMVFDPVTQILFSGDAIYPGRLYFKCGEAETMRASMARLTDFVETRDVKWLLGAHIEMTVTPGETFPQSTGGRRGEHLLELPASIASEIKGAMDAQAGQYRVEPHAEFMLFPHPADPTGKSPPNWCLTEG